MLFATWTFDVVAFEIRRDLPIDYFLGTVSTLLHLGHLTLLGL